MKQKIRILCFAVCVFAFLLFGVTLGEKVIIGEAERVDLITTQEGLTEAIHNAENGGEILVGDIDFKYGTGIPTGMTISKSVTIKSGKDGKAVFSAGAFAVKGGISEQDALDIRFENIIFQGLHDVKNTDWETYTPAISTWLSAVFFNRCVNASFIGCEFVDYYAMSYGGAIQAIYSSSDSASYCLSLYFEDCKLNNNVAKSGGGAVYLSGVDNISLYMKNCQLNENVSSCGGAIRADQADITLENCRIENNRYLPSETAKGGGVYVSNGLLNLKNCVVTGNAGKHGGGLALAYNESVIDGCIISGNTAIGNGGGLWVENSGNNLVTVINTTLAENKAETDGGIFVSQNDVQLGSGGVGKIFVYLSTLSGNLPNMRQIEEGRLSFFASALYGEGGENISPTEENGYNYYAAEAHSGNAYAHLHSDALLSSSVLKETKNGRFSNCYGEFFVGDNSKDGAYRFIMEEESETEIVPFGEIPKVPIAKRRGYSFKTWKYADGTEFSTDKALMIGGATESVDLYAAFEPNVYTVTYNFGGNNVQVSQVYGENLAMPKAQEKEGYVFVGYFTAKEGQGDKLTKETALTVAGDITYYAYYEKEDSLLWLVFLSIGTALAAATAVTVLLRRKKTLAVEPIAETSDDKKTGPDTSKLSPREKEVLKYLLEGKQRNEISKILYVSENTIKKQITSIYQKLEVSSRSELFARFK